MERQMFTGFLILVVLMSASDLLDGCTDRQARLRDEQILALLRERAACPQAAEVTAPAPMLNGYDLSDCLGYEGFIAACFTARGQRVGSTYPDAGVGEPVAAREVQSPKPLRYRMGRVIRLGEHVWVEADQARDGLRWGENCVAQAGGTLTVVGGVADRWWRVRYAMPKGAEGGGTLCPDGIEARVDPADLEGP
jgi:hypothetical protein